MAIGLPYVLHGLLESTVVEECAAAYILWRSELDNVTFQENVDQCDEHVDGLGSLQKVSRLGEVLQEKMNDLSKYVNDSTDAEISGLLTVS